MADVVTLQEYKTYLNQNYFDSIRDNEKDIYYTNILLPGVSEALRAYFDNDFQSTTRSETLSVEERTRKLFLKYRPASDITSITVSGTTLSTDDYELLDNYAVVLQNDLDIVSQIAESYYWPYGYNHIVINYTGGLALTRAHKWMLCKLIAKMDEADTKNYSNVDEAANAFTGAFNEESEFVTALNMAFRNIYV